MGLNDDDIRFPRWESYQQILFHFYSNANLREIDGNLLTPAYRWNPLQIVWQNTGSPTPPTMHPGGIYKVTLYLQNTGTVDWDDEVKLVYYWLWNGSPVANATLVDVDNLDKGADDDHVTLSVRVPGDFRPGDSPTLVIDLRRRSDAAGDYFSNREQGRPWFDVRYTLCLGGTCQHYLPAVLKDYTPPVPCLDNQQLIVNGDFEDGYPTPAWTERGPYRIIYEGPGAYTGNWHAFLAGYPEAEDELYQDFTLPPGSPGATLEYSFQLGTYDNDPPAHHFFFIYLKTDEGQTIQRLDRFDNTAQLEIWHHLTIDVYNLSFWAGRSLRLSLEADTDDRSLSAFHVDAVRFTVNCDLDDGATGQGTIKRFIPADEPAQVVKPAGKGTQP